MPGQRPRTPNWGIWCPAAKLPLLTDLTDLNQHNCLSRQCSSIVHCSQSAEAILRFLSESINRTSEFPGTSPHRGHVCKSRPAHHFHLYSQSPLRKVRPIISSRRLTATDPPPSCVRTIQDTLQALVPSPYATHVSILSQCVTVHHPTVLSPLAIREAIQDAGFDIADTTGAGQLRPSDTLDSSSRKAAVHLEQCQFCQHRLKSALEISIRPLTSETTAIRMDGPLRLTLSVGGMTCAACSSTVTQLLSGEEGVTDVSVNLMGNSATLVVKSKELIAVVEEVIESAGYETSVVAVEPLQVKPVAMEVVHGQRTVALRIEGMFCE
jgi:copper chaperone CopZ